MNQEAYADSATKAVGKRLRHLSKYCLLEPEFVKSFVDQKSRSIAFKAKTVEEAAKLIEQGFDYICELDSVKLFRKRKQAFNFTFFFCKLLLLIVLLS
jgi:hypothetical protein